MGYGTWNVQYGYAPVPSAGVPGTALALSTATEGLPILDRPSINIDIGWHDAQKARNHPLIGSADVTLITKMPKFSFSCPVTPYVLCDFVYALFNKISAEAVATPFKKDFIYASTNVSIDKGGTAVSAVQFPHIFDIWRVNPGLTGTDQDEQLISAIPSQITFSIQNGLLSMAVDMVALDCDIKAVNYTGTLTKNWNNASGHKFCAFTHLKVDTIAVPMQDFTMTVPNGVSVFPYNLGVPQTMILAGTPPRASGSFTIPMDKAAAEALWTEADPTATPFVAGPLQPTQSRFQIFGPRVGSDAVTTESDVLLDIRGYPKVLTPGGGADQQVTVIEIEPAFDGSNEPITISAADATDRAWT